MLDRNLGGNSDQTPDTGYQKQKLKGSVIFLLIVVWFLFGFLNLLKSFDLIPIDVGLIRFLGQGQNSTWIGSFGYFCIQ